MEHAIPHVLPSRAAVRRGRRWGCLAVRKGEDVKVRQPLRSNDIREQNEKLVLHLIYTRSTISQSEVANITGLKPPTVYRIFSLLEQQGLIRESEGESLSADKKGRRPSPYAVVPTALYSIGVDFWSRNAAVALFDFRGRIILSKTSLFESDVTAETVTAEIIRMIDEALTENEVAADRLLGIGIGAPGVVDIENGVVVVYERIKGMNNFDLRSRLVERFDVPVEVHNNCSVIALGAYRYGSAQGQNSLTVFLVRSGMGGAFIHGGQLYVNQNRTAFEIGNFHLTPAESDNLQRSQGIVPIARPGSGGRTGAAGSTETKLEDFISEDTIFHTVSSVANASSWEDVDALLRSGDARVMESLSPIGELFSNEARNVAHLLNPEAIMIVSRYRSLSEYFARSLTEHMKSDQDSARVNLVKVLAEEYDTTLACQGAADLIFDTFFSIRH